METEKVFPHNFRHMFARIFYRVTGNLLQLADILGHSSIEVTRIYASDGIMEWKKSMEMLEILVEWRHNVNYVVVFDIGILTRKYENKKEKINVLHN